MATTRIREALELLRERGWTKAPGGEDLEGSICIMVAVGRASGVGEDQFDRDRIALQRVVREQYGRDGIIRFNNHPDTTFADVELVMEKAAVMREEAVEP